MIEILSNIDLNSTCQNQNASIRYFTASINLLSLDKLGEMTHRIIHSFILIKYNVGKEIAEVMVSLLTLPVELVYRILDNLDDIDVLILIYNVCSRLRLITHSYRRYQVTRFDNSFSSLKRSVLYN